MNELQPIPPQPPARLFPVGDSHRAKAVEVAAGLLENENPKIALGAVKAVCEFEKVNVAASRNEPPSMAQADYGVMVRAAVIANLGNLELLDRLETQAIKRGRDARLERQENPTETEKENPCRILDTSI